MNDVSQGGGPGVGGRKRILFVDDEKMVLDALRNLLRKNRSQWDMVFAEGGEQALAELGQAPFDVVVTDMRMPGMDGAALLARIKERYPGIARIVLSGHSDRAAVMRALPVTHQFLSKPCDAGLLREVIDRTCNLGSLLDDEKIRQVIGRLDSVPSLPQAYWELKQVVSRPDSSIGQVSAVVQRDAAMAAKVLQLVNSAFFGLGRKIASIQQAVMYLGTELISGLALTAKVFSATDASLDATELSSIQEQSLLTANLCRRFLPNPAQAEEAYTAALVHDIGELVMAVALRQRFNEVVKAARQTQTPLHVVEQELLGVTHAEIGAFLLGMWGLPFPVVEAVAHHHHPRAVTEGPREVLAALHVADALVDTVRGIARGQPVEQRLDMEFLEASGMAGQLPRWTAIARQEGTNMRDRAGL